MRPVNRVILQALIAASALFSGAALAAPAKLEPVKLTQAADPEGLAMVQTLEGKIKGSGLSFRDKREGTHARACLYMAALNTEPKVVAGALECMSLAWVRDARKGSDRPEINADFKTVVRARLESPIPVVRGQALNAARLLLGGKEPDEAALAIVVKLAKDGNPTERYQAIGLLFNVSRFQLPRAQPGDLKQRIIDVHLPALADKNVPVVIRALHNLRRTVFPQVPRREAIQTAARKLWTHSDAGVRGLALSLAANTAAAADKPAVFERLTAALSDKSAFVRAMAAEAIAVLDNQAAAHELVKLLGDGAEAVHTLKGFALLEGEPEELRLLPEGGARVDESALLALQALTEGTKGAFTYQSLGGGKERDEKRKVALDAAKKWYEGAKATIPAVKKVP